MEAQELIDTSPMPIEDDNTWLQHYTRMQVKGEMSGLRSGPLTMHALHLKMQGLADAMFI